MILDWWIMCPHRVLRLRARGGLGSTAAARASFSDRSVQYSFLSSLKVILLYILYSTVCTVLVFFCRKIVKCCTIKYYVRKIQNPWILGTRNTVLNSTVFSIFSAKKISKVNYLGLGTDGRNL
jgi:hypothetical protein